MTHDPSVDMAVTGMAKKPISKIQHLSARVESQLHQFAGEDEGYDDVSRGYPYSQRKRNPLLRAGLAGGGLAGVMAVAANKDKLKAGYQSAKAGVDSGIASARKAATPYVKTAKKGLFRGMQGVAGAAEGGMRAAEKAGFKGGLLGRAARYVSKKSMRLFNAELADTLVRLERKVTAAAIEERMREFAAVDLGKTSEGYIGDCSPSVSAPYYPSLYVSDRKDAKLSEIPAKGKAIIEYRLRSRSVNYAKDGTETHSSDIEVQSIDPQTHLEAILARYDFARGDVLQKVGRRALMDQGYLMPKVYVPPRVSVADARLSPQLKHAATNPAKAAKWLRENKSLRGGPGKGTGRLDWGWAERPATKPKIMAKDSVAAANKRAAMFAPKPKYDLGAILERYDFGSGGQLKLRRAIGALQKQGRMGKAKKLWKRVLAGPDTASVFRDGIPAGVDRNTLIKSKMKEAAAWGKVNHGFEAVLGRYDFGDRARNPAGQYASGYDVSSDDMAAAYGTKKKKAAMIVGAGGATVAAAMAGKKYAPAIGRSMGPAIGRVLRGALA